MPHAHARIVSEARTGSGDGFGIAVDQQQAAPPIEPAQDFCGMAAAAEGAIEIGAPGAHVQSVHCRLQQHRGVLPRRVAHGCLRGHCSQPQRGHVRADVVLADGLADLGEVSLLAPQFELVAHAQQHGALLDACRGALTARQ